MQNVHKSHVAILEMKRGAGAPGFNESLLLILSLP